MKTHTLITCTLTIWDPFVVSLPCAYAHACVVPVYTYDANMSISTRDWKSFHSLVLVLASLRRKVKPGQRKHEHKHKPLVLMLTSHRFTRFLVLMLTFASYV